uniref:Cdc45 protein n=1 Tax=Phallusia mammillata TaxID=59560 RepID=A0A6F9D9G5_9ASCI|nr:cdc45 protein [Phallusia mammillata]
MLLTDPVKDFFHKIVHQRVLVMVALDVDALCACKILQSLFRCDNIQYTLVPVSKKSDLVREYEEHKEQNKHIILLNCGANIDLLNTLDPSEDVTFYVIDSHRPIDLVNFYCERQVYLILKHNQQEIDAIPDYDVIYREYDSDEEESEGDDDTEQVSKRRRFDEASLMRKKERREWEERRKEIIFDYEEFSYYGTCASLIVYDLAWRMSKDNNELLWWAIAGVTDQFQNKRIGRDRYVTGVLELQGHMSRLNHANEDEDNSKSIDCMRINFEHDLDLALYRHWSLFESLCHSISTVSAFKVWTNIGMKKLHQFLAEMGIPLTQCKQNYEFMDTKMRDNLQTLVEESALKFGLKNLKFQSFSAQYGFNHKICASDAVYSVNALLENIKLTDTNGMTDKSNFVDALEGLSRISAPKMKEGLELAKLQLQAIRNNVGTFIDVGQVLSYGPFLYTSIKEGSPDYKYFSHPTHLNLFSHYLLQSYVRSLGKSKREKAIHLPLVICAPCDIEEGISIIAGIPPLADDSRKNLFGNAFIHAAERTKSRTSHDYFDSSIITMKNEDRSKFIDALITIMT